MVLASGADESGSFETPYVARPGKQATFPLGMCWLPVPWGPSQQVAPDTTAEGGCQDLAKYGSRWLLRERCLLASNWWMFFACK